MIKNKILIMFLIILPSFSLSTSAIAQKELSKQEIINIAVKKANGLGYSTEAMSMVYDKGNMRIKAHCKRSGVSTYNKITRKWDKDLPSTPEKDYPQLSGKDYQAVYFSPKKMQLGGDLWVFVDRNTGEVIAYQRGK